MWLIEGLEAHETRPFPFSDEVSLQAVRHFLLERRASDRKVNWFDSVVVQTVEYPNSKIWPGGLPDFA